MDFIRLENKNEVVRKKRIDMGHALARLLANRQQPAVVSCLERQ